jgi:HAD domain in Swiss Army Knife RNA repair proteins
MLNLRSQELARTPKQTQLTQLTKETKGAMILFLDFDGVLHPESWDAELFCRTPILWDILRACPHVSVVFSTAWRETHPVKQLVSLTTRNGGEGLKHRFVGLTPQLDSNSIPSDLGCRETECFEWLKQNGHGKTPWLALDDIDYLFSPSSPNLYLTDYRHGLTELDAHEVIEKLNSAGANGKGEKQITNVSRLTASIES